MASSRSQQIALPGVYMDAVNPDYMTVRLLNPHAQPITAWLLPGNYLFERAPVLISFYHGSQQFWLGLPLFWLFGTTVVGLRLTHAMFALGVLAALYALLVRSGPRPWLAALACAALAIDPAFSYAFRTQSYITLAPAAWLFLSLYCLQRAADGGARRRRWLLGSGALYGLAIVGYFIYAFFLPAMLAALYWSRTTPAPDGERPRATWVLWFAGVAIGGIFYPVGYALLIRQLGGVPEGVVVFPADPKGVERVQRTGIARGTRRARVADDRSGRPELVCTTRSCSASTQRCLVPRSRRRVLAGGPFALWLYAELRGCASAAALADCVARLVRLGRADLRHAVVRPPLHGAAAARVCRPRAGASMRWQARCRRGASRWPPSPFPSRCSPRSTSRARCRRRERLHETRGSGLYSDAINRLAEDLDGTQRKPFVYFPDWGLSMPVAFLTGGRVGMDSLEDYAEARRKLCEGRDVALAVVTGNRRARIEAWREQLRWDAPTIQVYRQGDGIEVFEVASFTGRAGAPGCLAK